MGELESVRGIDADFVADAMACLVTTGASQGRRASPFASLDLIGRMSPASGMLGLRATAKSYVDFVHARMPHPSCDTIVSVASVRQIGARSADGLPKPQTFAKNAKATFTGVCFARLLYRRSKR